jgi:hypothetical protein
MKIKISFIPYLFATIFLSLFLVTGVKAAQYDCAYSVNAAGLPACCYSASSEPLEGIACRPEGKFLQKLGTDTPICKTSTDILSLATTASSKLFTGFNCFNGQLNRTCQNTATQCYNAGSDTCQAFTGPNPVCTNANKVTSCDQSCGACSSGYISCSGQCITPKTGICGAGYTLDQCTGTCSCPAGLTPSGFTPNTCISYFDRFREILDFGLAVLGGPVHDGKYDYSVTGPSTINGIFLKSDVAETLNWKSSTVPQELQWLLKNYNLCATNADCTSPKLCSEGGYCYKSGVAVGTACATNSSDCDKGQMCDMTSKKCVVSADPLKIVKDATDSNLLKMYDSSLANVGSAIYQNTSGNVGIGMVSPATPGATLQVNGGASIGYAASQAAPANGLAVSGGVGIGIAAPTGGSKLEVTGQVKITGGSPAAGSILTSDAAGLATWNAGISGTAGYLPKFATATTLGNSVMSESSGGIGIGIATPNASALLDLTSTTKGLLLPRMTTAQKNTISSPVAGLVVYDSSLNKLYYRNSSAWTDLQGPQGPQGPTYGIYNSLNTPSLKGLTGLNPGDAGGATMYNLGNVAIGTSSASTYALNVLGDAYFRDDITTDSNVNASVVDASDGINTGTIHTTGHVGIGTLPDPSYALNVGGNINTSGDINLSSGGDIIGANYIEGFLLASGTSIQADTLKAGSITTTGQVGIGTDNPYWNYQLDVNGNGHFSGNVNADSITAFGDITTYGTISPDYVSSIYDITSLYGSISTTYGSISTTYGNISAPNNIAENCEESSLENFSTTPWQCPAGKFMNGIDIYNNDSSGRPQLRVFCCNL